MPRDIIKTDQAPAAIGPYSQAIRVNDTVYLSGQIGLDPSSGELKEGIEAQTHQVLANLKAVAQAAGGSLAEIVKLTVFLTDLDNFVLVNEIMAQHFQVPYPARAAVGVAALPKSAAVEVEAVLILGSAS